MAKTIIGVMGGGQVSPAVEHDAYRLGALVAERGWVLLNGGRNAGVMAASAAGAHSRGGLVVGVLPDDHTGRMAEHVDIPILTGMGSARNNINVLSSDVVIACTGGAGTVSEVALAFKAGKPVIALNFPTLSGVFAGNMASGQLRFAETPEEAIEHIRAILSHLQQTQDAQES